MKIDFYIPENFVLLMELLLLSLLGGIMFFRRQDAIGKWPVYFLSSCIKTEALH